MNKLIIVRLFFLLHSLVGWSQYVVKTPSELESLKKLPQEKMYIDHTGPVVFAGEYFYYAIYCFNAQSNKLTNISRLAYVALVNDEKEYVFEHKLKMQKGLGQGDFFISANVPSGTYKLLGYTQWMKNNGLTQVFKDDIVIINPYLANQSKLLSSTTKGVAKNKESLSTKNKVIDSSAITFSIDKTSYSKREKVKLSLKNYKGYLGNGAYTVKVINKEHLGKDSFMDATIYADAYFNTEGQIKQQVGDSLFLPEQRGELFYGKVTNANGSPAVDKPVVISIPGKEFLLKFSRTDENGNFYSYLRKDYKVSTAVVQVEDESTKYDIKKGAIGNLDLSGLTFSDYTLTGEDKEAIVARSVHNQIENHFFQVKPDSILQGDVIDPFDGGTPETLLLDEYTRFLTFEETMVEIVTNAGYRNGGKGNDYVKVAQDFETSYDEEFNNFPSIILIDGVFIPNHEKIRTFDARNIEKISLIRDKFVLGGSEYQGMVSVETFNGDYLETHTYENSSVINFKKPEPIKNYYNQSYGSEVDEFSRIPDYRSLLFWKPHVVIDKNSYEFEFFTSDVKGEYEIMLNGFTSYGKPITLTKTFSVSENTMK
ncbi:MAG: hypothetical protein ACJAU2_001565 [Maribacter sp.]|jgi:hypothetical protein